MLCVFSPLSFYPIHRFLTHWKCISLQDIDMKSNQSMAVQKFRSRFRNFLVKAMQTCAREMKGNFSFPPGREALKKVVNWCCRPLISEEREEKILGKFSAGFSANQCCCIAVKSLSLFQLSPKSMAMTAIFLWEGPPDMSVCTYLLTLHHLKHATAKKRARPQILGNEKMEKKYIDT